MRVLVTSQHAPPSPPPSSPSYPLLGTNGQFEGFSAIQQHHRDARLGNPCKLHPPIYPPTYNSPLGARARMPDSSADADCMKGHTAIYWMFSTSPFFGHHRPSGCPVHCATPSPVGPAWRFVSWTATPVDRVDCIP